MNRIMRFTVLSIVYLVLMVLFYTIPAFIFWIFGASFIACIQNPIYIFCFTLLVNILLIAQFENSFDKNYYPKE